MDIGLIGTTHGNCSKLGFIIKAREEDPWALAPERKKDFSVEGSLLLYQAAVADEDGNAVFFEAKFQVKVRKALIQDDDDSSSGSYSGSASSSGSVDAVSGQWSLQADGSWHFTSGNRAYKNEWGYIANPYANAALGQSAADWFRFDEQGRMLTGWVP